MTGNEGNDSKCQEIVTKSNVQNETGKKSFNDEIQQIFETRFPHHQSDSLDRGRVLAVKKLGQYMKVVLTKFWVSIYAKAN